ncbi:magnesium and cobalt transport protein CorA [Corynebacterium poyangense]|uniref:magnesium and cobalt transport protein CorA n=1 Tax=Corynebacterium poyangense TaxID=2684405 RepID=UPI001CCA2D8B|nr:magnesium and cobalt transport protein CorA [Corynebacterium poyangense]
MNGKITRTVNTSSQQRNAPIPTDDNAAVEQAIEYCRVYHNGRSLPGHYSYGAAIAQVARISEQEGPGTSFVWLALEEPTAEQMKVVAGHFEVHELIVEDAVEAHQRPKVERYGDQLFIVVRSVNYQDLDYIDDGRQMISTGEIQMLVGKNFIITIRHHSPSSGLAHRLDHDTQLCARGPAALAWAVADDHVARYGWIADQLGEEVDSLEEEVFTPNSRFNIEQIYTFKREILEMRHAIAPLVPALRQLAEGHKDLMSKKLRSYFRDALDNHLIVTDRIAGYDERLTALIDAGVAKITMQQNQDMRTISALVGMAAVPTLIAGIYGMNFEHMPELSYSFGYPLVLLLMVVIVAFLAWWFRKNEWL